MCWLFMCITPSHSQGTQTSEKYMEMIANFTINRRFDLDCYVQFENFADGLRPKSQWHHIGRLFEGANFYNISIIDIVTNYTGWSVGRMRLGAFEPK